MIAALFLGPVLALTLGIATFATKGASVFCDDVEPKLVKIPIGRVAVLSFPGIPKEVVPGEAGFDFKTIKNDLVIKAIKNSADTNLVVYLEGRRCAFHLVASRVGPEILIVKDPKEKIMDARDGK